VGVDEDKIGRTLSEYSQSCDDGRFDDLAQLFTEDARFVVSGTAAEGRDSIRALLVRMLPDGSRGQHITSNSLVDVDGDTASATTDYLFVRPTAEGPALVAAGRYYDRLTRDGPTWRFTERTITMLGIPREDPDA
jgi:uncharacterized protein (TIGR02246 family)